MALVGYTGATQVFMTCWRSILTWDLSWGVRWEEPQAATLPALWLAWLVTMRPAQRVAPATRTIFDGCLATEEF